MSSHPDKHGEAQTLLKDLELFVRPRDDGYYERAWDTIRRVRAFLQASPSAIAAPDGHWWSFLRDVLAQGAAIQQDYVAGNHKTYEEYAARLDAAARERADQVNAVPQGRASSRSQSGDVPARLPDVAGSPAGTAPSSTATPDDPIQATEAEKSAAFEWLRGLALAEDGFNSGRMASVAVQAWSQLGMAAKAAVAHATDESIEPRNRLQGVIARLRNGTPSASEPPNDAALLDWIADEYITVDSFAMPTGGDDADVGWRFTQHFMAPPKERVIYEHLSDNLRDAIRGAMAAMDSREVKP